MADKDQGRESQLAMGPLPNRQHLREFLDGSTRSGVQLHTAAIGLGHYRPGWRWSLHAGPQTGRPAQRHVGYVLSGRMGVRTADGEEGEIGPGEAFELGPGSDAWVIGEATCTALDFSPIPVAEPSGPQPDGT